MQVAAVPAAAPRYIAREASAPSWVINSAPCGSATDAAANSWLPRPAVAGVVATAGGAAPARLPPRAPLPTIDLNEGDTAGVTLAAAPSPKPRGNTPRALNGAPLPRPRTADADRDVLLQKVYEERAAKASLEKAAEALRAEKEQLEEQLQRKASLEKKVEVLSVEKEQLEEQLEERGFDVEDLQEENEIIKRALRARTDGQKTAERDVRLQATVYKARMQEQQVTNDELQRRLQEAREQITAASAPLGFSADSLQGVGNQTTPAGQTLQAGGRDPGEVFGEFRDRLVQLLSMGKSTSGTLLGAAHSANLGAATSSERSEEHAVQKLGPSTDEGPTEAQVLAEELLDFIPDLPVGTQQPTVDATFYPADAGFGNEQGPSPSPSRASPLAPDTNSNSGSPAVQQAATAPAGQFLLATPQVRVDEMPPEHQSPGAAEAVACPPLAKTQVLSGTLAVEKQKNLTAPVRPTVRWNLDVEVREEIQEEEPDDGSESGALDPDDVESVKSTGSPAHGCLCVLDAVESAICSSTHGTEVQHEGDVAPQPSQEVVVNLSDRYGQFALSRTRELNLDGAPAGESVDDSADAAVDAAAANVADTPATVDATREDGCGDERDVAEAERAGECHVGTTSAMHDSLGMDMDLSDVKGAAESLLGRDREAGSESGKQVQPDMKVLSPGELAELPRAEPQVVGSHDAVAVDAELPCVAAAHAVEGCLPAQDEPQAMHCDDAGHLRDTAKVEELAEAPETSRMDANLVDGIQQLVGTEEAPEQGLEDIEENAAEPPAEEPSQTAEPPELGPEDTSEEPARAGEALEQREVPTEDQAVDEGALDGAADEEVPELQAAHAEEHIAVERGEAEGHDGPESHVEGVVEQQALDAETHATGGPADAEHLDQLVNAEASPVHQPLQAEEQAAPETNDAACLHDLAHAEATKQQPACVGDHVSGACAPVECREGLGIYTPADAQEQSVQSCEQTDDCRQSAGQTEHAAEADSGVAPEARGQDVETTGAEAVASPLSPRRRVDEEQAPSASHIKRDTQPEDGTEQQQRAGQSDCDGEEGTANSSSPHPTARSDRSAGASSGTKRQAAEAMLSKAAQDRQDAVRKGLAMAIKCGQAKMIEAFIVEAHFAGLDAHEIEEARRTMMPPEPQTLSAGDVEPAQSAESAHEEEHLRPRSGSHAEAVECALPSRQGSSDLKPCAQVAPDAAADANEPCDNGGEEVGCGAEEGGLEDHGHSTAVGLEASPDNDDKDDRGNDAASQSAESEQDSAEDSAEESGEELGEESEEEESEEEEEEEPLEQMPNEEASQLKQNQHCRESPARYLEASSGATHGGATAAVQPSSGDTEDEHQHADAPAADPEDEHQESPPQEQRQDPAKLQQEVRERGQDVLRSAREAPNDHKQPAARIADESDEEEEESDCSDEQEDEEEEEEESEEDSDDGDDSRSVSSEELEEVRTPAKASSPKSAPKPEDTDSWRRGVLQTFAKPEEETPQPLSHAEIIRRLQAVQAQPAQSSSAPSSAKRQRAGPATHDPVARQAASKGAAGRSERGTVWSQETTARSSSREASARGLPPSSAAKASGRGTRNAAAGRKEPSAGRKEPAAAARAPPAAPPMPPRAPPAPPRVPVDSLRRHAQELVMSWQDRRGMGRAASLPQLRRDIAPLPLQHPHPHHTPTSGCAGGSNGGSGRGSARDHPGKAAWEYDRVVVNVNPEALLAGKGGWSKGGRPRQQSVTKRRMNAMDRIYGDGLKADSKKAAGEPRGLAKVHSLPALGPSPRSNQHQYGQAPPALMEAQALLRGVTGTLVPQPPGPQYRPCIGVGYTATTPFIVHELP